MAIDPQDTGNNRLLSEFSTPTYEEWKAEAERSLKGKPLDKIITRTYEGISVPPIYRQDDVAGVPFLDSLPGVAPFLRGSDAAAAGWQICQELPYSTAEAFNQAVRYDLERGQTAVALPLDAATRLGQDPDEAVVGDVGQGGVSLATVDDVAAALNGIDLEQVPVYLGGSQAVRPVAALLLALLKRQGKSAAKLQGSLSADPLGMLASTSQLAGSADSAYNELAQLFTWAKANAPQLAVVTVNGQVYNDAGASAVQELAFVLATAVEYLRQMQARGLSVDEVAPRIRFSLAIGSNYFMEVAKIRAARVVWAKVIKAFGGSEAAQKLNIHARTALYNKTVHDPWVNMLRTTVEAFAGAVGGVNSMHTGPFDETIGQPDEFSRRIARNTQIILQHESQLTKVLDPAGGSWYVEKLTDDVARGTWALFRQVEEQGGMLAALQNGFPQTQVSETAAQRSKNLSTRKDILVGTNKYANLLESLPEANNPDLGELHRVRAKFIARYRTGNDNTHSTEVMSKLAQLRDAGADTVLAAAIDAALAGATLGEITRTLSGDSQSATVVTPLPTLRASEKFEAMRAFAEVYLAKHGARPKVFLANYGPLPKHKPRADFSTDFFSVGGFEVISNAGFSTPEAAAQAALESGAPVVVICGTDDVYPEIVPPLTQAIKSAKPAVTVILAGYPAEQIEAHKAAGVDDFIHIRANVVEVLSKLQQAL